MSIINFQSQEIAVKLVYYGPGLGGKTTSLQSIYASLPESQRPQMVSLATEVDRTIFFDFLPVAADRIRDFKVRLQLYTVPGQVFYNATRKLVLGNVDGVIFVADSQVASRDANLESMANLVDNLADLGLEPEKVPLVLQYNKRDLAQIDSIETMEGLYNAFHRPAFPSIAITGEGVFTALRALSQAVVGSLLQRGLGQQLTGSGSTVVAPGRVVEDAHESLGAATSFLVESSAGDLASVGATLTGEAWGSQEDDGTVAGPGESGCAGSVIEQPRDGGSDAAYDGASIVDADGAGRGAGAGTGTGEVAGAGTGDAAVDGAFAALTGTKAPEGPSLPAPVASWRPEPTGLGLWPEIYRDIGAGIDRAMMAGRWREAVVACETLLDQAVQQWQLRAAAGPDGPALPWCLLARGVTLARWQAFEAALATATLVGGAVTQGQAVSAVLVVLQVLW